MPGRLLLLVLAFTGAALAAGCSGAAPAGTVASPPSTAVASIPRSPGPAGSVTGIPSLAAGPVGPVALKAGPDLCALLSAADFSAAGVSGAGPVSKNTLSAPEAFYCVHAGRSGATGGIEFDAFLIDPAQGDQVTATVPPFGAEDVSGMVPGADKALVYVPSPPTTEPAQIGVQAGTLLFGIWVPRTDTSKAALVPLAALVVARAAAATAGTLTLPIQPVLSTDACAWISADDLKSIASMPLTPAEPTVTGGINFNDSSVKGTYLGRMVTCAYRTADGDKAIELEVVDSPGDPVLMKKIWDEQVAFYADWAARGGGSQKADVTPLSGIGDAAQKVRFSDPSDGHFQGWIVEAIKGEVFVRLVTGASVEEAADAPAVALAGRILDRAATFMAGS